MANRPQRDQILEVTIERLAYGGRGVGRVDGYVVFVPLTAPGDRVRARVKKARRRFCEAELETLLEAGPDRVEPPCPYFGRCGGCAWQHLSYPAQARAKEAIVRESLERLGGLGPLPYRPLVPAAETLHYRNKMEFAFHPEAVLGLHLRGFWDRVVEIDACLLPDPEASAILREVKAFVLDRGLSRWDPRAHTGLLRHLVFREAKRTGELMVGLVTGPGEVPELAALAEQLVAAHPRIASVVHGRTAAQSDAVMVESIEVLQGRDHIFEQLHGTTYAIRLPTFFQTNTDQADRLAEVVLDLARPAAGDRAVDLYCGVGAFALLLAPKVAHVWGIEAVEASIEAAKENAARAGIANATFVAGDARLTLPKVLPEIGTPDLFLLDPPRSGAGGKVMRRIGRSRSQRVIYVSCNPTTLAPDLAQLAPYGYEITAVQPVDLFPQTYHVETVVALERVREPDPGVK